MTVEGNRNALLALHDAEGDTRATAAHVAGCAECQAYLAAIGAVETVVREWMNEAPPADLRAAVLAVATLPAQLPAPRKTATASAAPLLGMLPLMAAFVGAVRLLGAAVSGWPGWDFLAPFAPGVAPFAAAAVALAFAGGLASLALAPVLVLENRKS